MPERTEDTGIPTRAIHESYLTLQQSHRKYRQAKSMGRDTQREHAEFQDAVLTFYELIRPHLKRKSSMEKFWAGKLPDYPERAYQSVERARQYYIDGGIAVWELQEHTQVAATANVNSGGSATAVADGSGDLADWHEQLNLGANQRLVSIGRHEEQLVYKELRAVRGLRQVDGWDTREKTRRESAGGFMAGETSEHVDLKHVPVRKLTKAKRLLAEAADKMSLLSQIQIDHEDGAIVNFDQSREEPTAEYTSAEYDSSPDI